MIVCYQDSELVHLCPLHSLGKIVFSRDLTVAFFTQLPTYFSAYLLFSVKALNYVGYLVDAYTPVVRGSACHFRNIYAQAPGHFASIRAEVPWGRRKKEAP